MQRDLEHPEITMCLRTGFPSWMQEDEEGCAQDAGESFGDEVYEERRANEICGD